MIPVALTGQREQLVDTDNTMTPATTASAIDRTAALKNGMRTRIARTAPAGSANPERNEYQKALRLLFVA